LLLIPTTRPLYEAHSVPLGAMKRYDVSVAEARRGLEVDPLSTPVNTIVGELISTARQWPQAIEPYRRTIELDPNVALVHDNLGIALEEIGDHDQAIEE
jgi:tetratricopeptide (TPR) repeat protein